MELQTYTGPIAVTLAYILVYYAFMIWQLRVKARLPAEYKARGETFDRYFTQDREMLAADRTLLNTLEHMPPFLALLWLDAVFVSPLFATVLGAVYVVARAIYPLAMGKSLGHRVGASIYVSTGPGYLVLIVLAGALGWALVQGSTAVALP